MEFINALRPKSQHKLTKRHHIAIIVGHTNENGGAYAQPPINSREYAYNSDLAFRLQKYIINNYFNKGIDCQIIYRDDIGCSGAYSMANELDAKVIIELHFNSVSNSKINGSETLFHDNHRYSRDLAISIQDAICDALRKGKESRGVKKLLAGDRGWGNLNLAKCPACIIEPFFGSNPADCQLVTEKRAELVESLSNALYLFVCGCKRS